MANVPGQKVGTDQGKGKGKSDSDALALFLKVFAGEVLTAFTRRSVTADKHIVRTIQNGKSAQFPVMGRTSGVYLAPGERLSDKRKGINHTEKVITIDGLLTADVMIFDIEDAMNHYDVAGEYSNQLGEALAIAADGAVLAEMAILCNLPAASDENIAGLGKASVLEVGTKDDLSTPAKLGEAIIGQLTIARAKLTSNYVPAGDRYFYTTPDNYSAILAALMPNAANYAALIDPETGNIRNVMGFVVVEVPHLTQGGAGETRGDDGISIASGQKHAFPATSTSSPTVKVALDNVVGLFSHRSAVGTVKLRDLALERDRDVDAQGDLIVGKYAMGHGGLRPEAVGALVFTAASEG
ncbi:major capsid protein [Salmonella phage ST17]|nr:major capsid protein [Salmonella phage ST17]